MPRAVNMLMLHMRLRLLLLHLLHLLHLRLRQLLRQLLLHLCLRLRLLYLLLMLLRQLLLRLLLLRLLLLRLLLLRQLLLSTQHHGAGTARSVGLYMLWRSPPPFARRWLCRYRPARPRHPKRKVSTLAHTNTFPGPMRGQGQAVEGRRKAVEGRRKAVEGPGKAVDEARGNALHLHVALAGAAAELCEDRILLGSETCGEVPQRERRSSVGGREDVNKAKSSNWRGERAGTCGERLKGFGNGEDGRSWATLRSS